tara:strand:- start:215 stop:1429 length:1215 start_codon:yes stop_codon:yes gene_type:complete
MLKKIMSRFATQPGEQLDTIERAKLPKGAYPFLTAEELIKPHARYIKVIKDDSEATKAYFETYYLPAIHRYAEIMQQRPHGAGEFAKNGGAIEVMIKRVAMALKLRKGLLLPQNEHPEEMSRKGPLWTYGVFAAALLKEMGGQLLSMQIVGFDQKHQEKGVWRGWYNSLNDCAYYKMKADLTISRSVAQTSSAMLLPMVLTKKGVQWLHDDINLIDCLLDQLMAGHKIEGNPIYTLIADASRAISEADLVLDNKKSIDSSLTVSTGEKIDLSTGEVTEDASSQKPVSPVKKERPAEKPQQETIEPIQTTVEAHEPKVSTAPVKTNDVTVKNFAQRVIADLESGKLTAKEAWILNNALHIKYPSTFNYYNNSPAELLNELEIHGHVIKKHDRDKSGSGRTIELKI